MTLREGVRKALAVAGCALWLASSLLPMFGGSAKHAVRCRGRADTGTFDDCFNDYLPVLELAAPLAAVLLLYPFARFAFSAWAPDSAERRGRWRLASRRGAGFWHPVLAVVALGGCAWALWRLVLYPLDRVTVPYIAFWAIFALWFALAAASALRAPRA